MRKLGLSLVFAIMMIALFASAASAEKLTPGTTGDIITNANGTATGVDTNDGSTSSTVIKNLTGHKTHTSYQNNTNSCASCHQTHTAAGDQLLFADGVYNTCTSCHDGTLGFLNVFPDGKLAADATADAKAMSGAGTFGGTHGASVHMANDSIQIKAAPGGNPADLTDANTTDDKVRGTMWGESFNCASCHAPHGSYSDRLLQYNPNGIGALPESKGGNQKENVPVYDQISGQTVAEALSGKTDAVVLLRSEDVNGKVTVAQYNKGTSGYAKSTAPWLYGYDSRTDGLTYWSRLEYVKTGDNPKTTDVVETDYKVAVYGSTSGVYFDYDQAQAYSTSAAGATELKAATKGFIARPVVVRMAKEGYETIQSAYYSGAPLAKFSGKTEQQLKDLGYTVGTDTDKTVKNVGVKMSQFCAACHTDYLAKNETSGGSHFGSDTAAYRHSTDSDSYTCVRCHYGHGTDAYLMKDALGNTIKSLVAGGKTEAEALSYMQDNNASSALKKFTNMSVCWACHNSSHAETIKNTDRLEGHPTGMPTGY